MLKSMTGFGRFEKQNGDLACKAEIRSVNNRFIDINTRLPKTLSSLELGLKNLVKARCTRGSFDVSVTLEQPNGDAEDKIIKPNLTLAAQYCKAFQGIRDHLGLEGELDINAILTLKDVIKVEPPALDPTKEALILETVETALSALVQMRREEGELLQADILNRLSAIAERAEFIKSRQPQILQDYKKRFREKIQALADGVEVDDLRLAQETAIMADRCDVTEEIVRLESHLNQFRNLVDTEEPIGRKLEFLSQEINRETNTIGSKTIDSQVSQAVIEVKSELEKIREQLQNIE